MKRFIPVLSLFLCMCLVGGGMAVVMSSTAMAGPNPNDCNDDVCVESDITMHWLSCLRYKCDGDYAVYACNGRCPEGGKCSCEWEGCWTDPFGQCE